MKTLVVGDIHGRYEIVERALETYFPVVFVGDFLDSFTRSPEDQARALRLAIVATQERKDVTVIKGNHEMSYIDPWLKCSGWNPETRSLMMHLDTDVLVDYAFVEGFLITHAGVSQRYLDYKSMNLAEYLNSGDFDEVGRSRGGLAPCGGLRWCDWREFEPVEGIDQIFGHTRGREIRTNGNNWCIDVLEENSNLCLFIENGKATVVDLMKI